jgi:hypothetical protein
MEDVPNSVQLKDFHCVSTRVISLTKSDSGIHASYPVMFDCWYFSVVHTTIHSALSGLSFKHFEYVVCHSGEIQYTKQ